MKVLVAIDLDATPEQVVDQASDWTARMGATLDVVYVDDAVRNSAMLQDPAVRQVVHAQLNRVRDARQARLSALVDHLPPALRGQAHYRVGAPWREIVELGNAYDLILVATHGRSGLEHLFLGSVAERVVHAASCPVLVLRLPQTSGD